MRQKVLHYRIVSKQMKSSFCPNHFPRWRGLEFRTSLLSESSARLWVTVWKGKANKWRVFPIQPLSHRLISSSPLTGFLDPYESFMDPPFKRKGYFVKKKECIFIACWAGWAFEFVEHQVMICAVLLNSGFVTKLRMVISLRLRYKRGPYEEWGRGRLTIWSN